MAYLNTGAILTGLVSIRLTWLREPDVEDLVHLRVVGCDVKDVLGMVRHARDVDWYQVLRDLLPPHRAGAAGAHVEHFGPQPAPDAHKHQYRQIKDSQSTASPICADLAIRLLCSSNQKVIRSHLLSIDWYLTSRLAIS